MSVQANNNDSELESKSNYSDTSSSNNDGKVINTVGEYNGFRVALFTLLVLAFLFICVWLVMYIMYEPFSADDKQAEIIIAKHGNLQGEVYWIGKKDSTYYLYFSSDTATSFNRQQIKIDSLQREEQLIINDAWINIKSGKGVMVGNDNLILFSDNTFKSWRIIESPDKRWEKNQQQQDDIFNDLHVVLMNDSTGEGIAAGEKFSFLRTKDFGATWYFNQAEAINEDFNIKEGVSEKNILAFVVNDKRTLNDTIIISSDKGVNWNYTGRASVYTGSEEENIKAAALKLRYKAKPQSQLSKDELMKQIKQKEEAAKKDKNNKTPDVKPATKKRVVRTSPTQPNSISNNKNTRAVISPVTFYKTYNNLFYSGSGKKLYVTSNANTNFQEQLFSFETPIRFYRIPFYSDSDREYAKAFIAGTYLNSRMEGFLITKAGKIFAYNSKGDNFNYITQLSGIDSVIKITGKPTANYFIVFGNDSLKHPVIYTNNNSESSWLLKPLVVNSGKELPISESTFFVILLFAGMFMFFISAQLNASDFTSKVKKQIAKDEKYARLIENTPTTNDALNFKINKQVVVQTIKNKFTVPPVNIVISGEWGSGKSSLMKQIQEEFADDEKTIPLWFNVWHMQTEQHLIGTFVNSMLRHLDTNKESFKFRFRLFWLRLKTLNFSSRFTVFLLLANIAAILLYLLMKIPIDSKYIDSFRALTAPVLDGIQVLFSPLFNLSADKPLPYILTIISTIAGGYLISKEFVPSGLSKFFNLIPKDKFKIETALVDTGFRERYKKEVWEIFRASQKSGYRFLVFIDDIDRIEGKKIIELLETINFITDTASKPQGINEKFRPPIYFIMGMYLEEIIRNVDTQLRENEKGASANGSTHEYNLGARYMEKMIDLIVKVPALHEIDKKDVNVNSLLNLK